jgi:hypothetical protein
MGEQPHDTANGKLMASEWQGVNPLGNSILLLLLSGN